MRDIKFRAWDKKYEGMREVLTLSVVSKEVIVKTATSMRARPLEEVELMQFTGLKDRNGREIYEGDIVCIEDQIVADNIGGFNRYEPLNHLAEVRFVSSAFGAEIRELAEGLGRGFYTFSRLQSEIDISSIEVIGTIYENPELLK